MSTIRPSSIIYRPSSSAICCLLSVFCLRLSTIVERSLQIHPFFCKTNPIFLYFSPKTTISLKNKPNSKPIQTQFWPKNESYCAESSFTTVFCYLLAKTYHPIRVPKTRMAKPNKPNFIFLLSQNPPKEHYITRTRILNNF